MKLHDIPEAARPDGEAFISMAEACERWPAAFVDCLRQLDGKVVTAVSTAMFPRFNGTPHLFLWADVPGHPGMEQAACHKLPPDIAAVREMLEEVAQR
ncbi:hypothetical protein [Hydrogenophaga sp. BPS33]|uniref:hypothetical protein n=1 Tax=Hydrogenophaga sp. BPS33 TaxID=2651974 RepID=UPI00132053C2|nr:hypothetical protein [Hydrogenophaga sp. BPS33]QHE86513.1 hypothetical protein F9K07_17205 [Hydrogenophaga sp. BPS33]